VIDVSQTIPSLFLTVTQGKFVVTEISAQQIWPIFKGQNTGRLPETSVTNCKSTLRKIPEELRSYLHRGGGLKSRKSG
jgi:hypothetical protein